MAGTGVYLVLACLVLFFVLYALLTNEDVRTEEFSPFRSGTITTLPQIENSFGKAYRTFNPSLTYMDDSMLYATRIGNYQLCGYKCAINTRVPSMTRIQALVQKATDKVPSEMLYAFRLSNNAHCDDQDAVYSSYSDLSSYIVLSWRGRRLLLDVTDPSGRGCVRGFEDPRVFLDEETVYITANACSGNDCKVEIWLLTLSKDALILAFQHDERAIKPLTTVRLVRPLTHASRDEKNWMPFIVDGELYLVYSISPHVVLRCDTNTGVCTEFSNTTNTLAGYGLRGGSQIRKYQGVYYGLIHKKIGGTQYLTLIYAFEFIQSVGFVVTGVSEPFIISQSVHVEPFIQFVSGFEIVGDQAFVTYGEHDCDSKQLTIPMSDLVKLIKPLK